MKLISMSLVTQVNKKFQNYLAFELEHSQKSYFFQVPPLLKLVVSVGLILLVNYFINKPEIWLFFSFMLLFAVFFFKINISRFLKFTLILGVVYPALTSIPLFFMTPGETIWQISLSFLRLSISKEGVRLGVNYFLRILTNIEIIAFLIASTPFNHIIHALRQLKIPGLISSLLIMTYRYFFFFFDNLVTLIRADATRNLKKLPFKARFIHLSNLFGHLLLQSIHQGASIHRAMLARGWLGEFPLLSFSINPKSTVIYIILTGFLVVAGIIAQFNLF